MKREGELFQAMWRYVAYGLELCSPFPLPGMRPGTGEQLPTLTLGLTTSAMVQSAWSGSCNLPTWRGRLGDGCELIIERGWTGDLLFTYGDRARFRLDASSERLDCAPERAGLDWLRALISKIVCNVSIIRGYEGLHASVVDSPEGVLAFAGPSGTGKSTLAAELVHRGFPLFADDVLILGSDASGVQAHPATPHMTVADSAATDFGPDELGHTLTSYGGERWLTLEDTSNRPRPVRMLWLLTRGPRLPLKAERLPANHLLLAPYMLGFLGDEDRQRRRFEVYADLVDSAAIMRLTRGPGDRPSETADVVERALGQPQPLAGSKARP